LALAGSAGGAVARAGCGIQGLRLFLHDRATPASCCGCRAGGRGRAWTGRLAVDRWSILV